MKGVVISKRKLRRYEMADDIAAHVRKVLAMPAYTNGGKEWNEEWNEVLKLVIKWIPLAGKQAFRERLNFK